MIRKFWNAAIWSNLSAHRPAMTPSVPMIAAPSSANTMIHSGAAKSGIAKNSVTMNTPVPTSKPRRTAAPT